MSNDGLFSFFRPFLLVLVLGIGAMAWLHHTGAVERALNRASGGYLSDQVPSIPAPAFDSGAPASASLADIASQIARHPDTVDCSLPAAGDGLSLTLGESQIGGDQVRLSQTICSGLGYVQHGLSAEQWRCVYQNSAICDSEVNWGILSLETLAHESYHSYGVSSESEADCYGLQTTAFVAQGLGVPQDAAQALVRYYWAHYQSVRMAPPAYQLSGDCRDGGKDDLHPDSSVWPG